MTEKNLKEQKIEAILILEILGRPKEHLVESLEKIIEQMKEEKGVEIVKKEVHEPKEVKEKKDMFTTFAEIEVELEEVMYLIKLLFKYMPAHIELISPEKLHLSNNGLNELLNEVSRRLHGYDEVARVLQMERAVLEKRLREANEKNSGK